MDPSLSFHKHCKCNYVSDRIDRRNNMLKTLVGSSWGLEKGTLLLTYNALRKSIASYAAPTQVTRALRRYRQRRIWPRGERPGPTRWPVLTISTRSPSCWKSRTTQICFLSSTLWTVWRRITSVMAITLKSQDLDPWRRLSTPDITQLFFLDSAQAGWKTTRICTHTR